MTAPGLEEPETWDRKSSVNTLKNFEISGSEPFGPVEWPALSVED